MTIGERIKQIREGQGLLQKELADRLKVSPEAISLWETDQRTKGLERLSQIAKALGVSEAKLLGADSSDLAFLSQLGFTPDDLASLTDDQRDILQSTLAALLKTFKTQNLVTASPSAPVRLRSILIVDDEIKLCHLLSRAFRLRGFHASYHFNGKSAMHHLLQRHERPDVILLDLKMPQVDGPTFLKQLRLVNQTSKVFLMTAYPEDLATAHLNGSDGQIAGHFVKPLRLDEIMTAVEQAVQ